MEKLIDKDNIHVYIFAGERIFGRRTNFIEKAKIKGTKEEHYLINSALSYIGDELFEQGKLSLVFSEDWDLAIRSSGRDFYHSPPNLNWIAEEYLVFKNIISEHIPEDKKQHHWSLDERDNYIYVIYYVDTVKKEIIDYREADKILF